MASNHRIAVDLQDLFGSEAGTRRTAAQIARELYRRSVYTNRAASHAGAFDLMWEYEARGLVENSPGLRGGAGWKLSAKGAALITRTLSSRNAG